MKRSRITLFFSFLVLVLIFMQAEICAAYQLGWTAIQHRVYESGNTINRLAFEIRDDSGNYVDSASVVTGAILRPPKPNGDPDPSGTPVNLTPINFDPLYDYYGSRFNTISSAWEYNTPLQISEFNANILDPMVIGTYTLEVSTDTGPTLIGQIDFDFLLDLPIVSSRSFQICADSTGNLYWTWNNPEQLTSLAKIYNLQTRASVGAYASGELVALYWPNTPVEMGSSFLPKTLFQTLTAGADEIRFHFQIRTSNNNARAYSNSIAVDDLSSPICISPKKTSVVIPLMN